MAMRSHVVSAMRSHVVSAMRSHVVSATLLRARPSEGRGTSRLTGRHFREPDGLPMTRRAPAKFAFFVSMCLHFGPMGALSRATVSEVEELVAGDPEWWSGFCGAIAEGGREAIRREQEMRGWAWGALWRWIVGDEARYRDYMQALEAYVQGLALETITIADGSEDAKLRVDTRFKLAGKVDAGRGGDKGAQSGGGVKVVLVNFVQDEGGRVIELEAATARVAVSEFSGGEAAQIKGLTQGE